MMKLPPAILAISDQKYLPNLRALAASVNFNFPQAHLILYLVNVTEDSEHAHLRSLHSKTEIIVIEETLDKKTMMVGLNGKTMYTELAGFCVNLRVRAIRDLLQRGIPQILFVDADTLIRKDINSLFDLLVDHDIVIHKRPHEKEFMRVAGGVIAVNNTVNSHKFFDAFVEVVDQLGNRDFFSDQWGFHLTEKKLGQQIRIRHLPKTFIDWDFDPDSFIWVGKGQRKYEDEKYIAEENAFLSKSSE